MVRDWYVFAACLMLSFSIWLVMNLSRPTSGTRTVSVLACSNIEGRSDVAVVPVDISARCSASGFRHIALSLSDEVVKVFFDASGLKHEGEDLYYADQEILLRSASEIFGAGVTVESFAQQGAHFQFRKEAFRKVAVTPVSYVTYAPQYMGLDELTLSADSVLIYGEPERLKNIDRIRTVPITLRDTRRDAHGTVALEKPSGVRLSKSELDYTLPVGRFVEMNSTVRIVVRNAPHDTELVILPPTANVTWRCSFPVRTDPGRSSVFYVDYRDFASSETGKCVVRSSGIPDGVISWTVEPQVCECVAKISER